MNKTLYKPALNAAIIFAALCVIIGAMGAHALKGVLSEELLGTYETAVKYQFYHSLALAFTGMVYYAFPSVWVRRATWAFVIGILLFSGSIYLLVYLKQTATLGLGKLGILTPIGGLFLIAGWILLLIGINKRHVTSK
ncbi:DUF423 domain-containing protein [Taibaiella lutea]|uniref:DUF423 domain-containing protein n=1 Tax=Taibaiella lutea TaxID=2608001 RepID=A0A5M6CNA4_9BACT|nr:DUF423 domain-containing protein [Taibaiella lutea]KAA5536537.1 DUF423 domain-containing protein [Taibaiella lutea]